MNNTETLAEIKRLMKNDDKFSWWRILEGIIEMAGSLVFLGVWYTFFHWINSFIK